MVVVSNCKEFFKFICSQQQKSSIFILFFWLLFSVSATGQSCPTVNSSGVFESNSDVIITSYHQSMAKVSGGVVVWGEDMAPNGTSDTNGITEITPANGYNYTGTIRHFAVSGNSGGQAFLATSTNLYAWGTVGEVISSSFKATTAFGTVTLNGFTANQIVDMHATSDALFVLLTNGTVWVATSNSNNTYALAVTGNANTDMTVWQQVETSNGNPLTGVTQVTGTKLSGFALTTNGDIYAWGNEVELGNGGSTQNLNYATLMNGLPTTPKYITAIYQNASTSGVLALGTDKKVYGVGANTAAKIIDATNPHTHHGGKLLSNSLIPSKSWSSKIDASSSTATAPVSHCVILSSLTSFPAFVFFFNKLSSY